MLPTASAVLCLLGLATTSIVSTPASPYLAPGTPQVGGVRHLALIYHGQRTRVPWTAEALMPYVAYVDEDGVPRDWLFDSFLFIEFAADSGVSLNHYYPDRPQPTFADWQWLADSWFRERTGLIGLEQAVAKAGRVLGDHGRRVNVVITLPIPFQADRAFGPLPGESESLDLSLQANRERALDWYISEVQRRWSEGRYRHLNLVGFYWTAETMTGGDLELCKWLSARLHRDGLLLYWIPYFGASGISNWRDYGIDCTMLQPNHFFTTENDPNRLARAAHIAELVGCGIEIEFDGRALASEDLQQRFWGYLDAGAKYGWMTEAVLGYYEGGGAVKLFAEGDALGRTFYDALYRFVKGRYTPSGRVQLPEVQRIIHDTRGNLALVSRGAKITGAIRREDQPELVPEKIIDGEIANYGGMNGFGYFAIPGSFTVELPEVATVARTQTMLFALDGRHFRYRIDTSLDGQRWRRAVDKSQGEWGGWQVDEFAPRKARFVRFSGLYNSANDLFQVVEFEVYSGHVAPSE